MEPWRSCQPHSVTLLCHTSAACQLHGSLGREIIYCLGETKAFVLYNGVSRLEGSTVSHDSSKSCSFAIGTGRKQLPRKKRRIWSSSLVGFI
ncbi:hypothetical protein BJX64DRAFT_253105 [Aspergillus heterothallicus]